jgi:hypothetical protein
MKPKLKPEVKKMWLAALRDPSRYVQFRGGLRDDDYDGPQECLCCLGVLNDISGLGEWGTAGNYITPGVRDEWREAYARAKRDWPGEGEEYWRDWAAENAGPQFEEEEEGIHINVAEWAFVDISADVHIPYINAESIRDRLPEDRVEGVDLSNGSIANLNDDYGATFEMLADLIEEQL